MKKFIRKPYAGKPHVRIDEGAGKGNQSLSCSTLPGTKKTSILGVGSILLIEHQVQIHFYYAYFNDYSNRRTCCSAWLFLFRK